MSKHYRQSVGFALRSLTTEPFDSVPYRDVVDFILENEGLSEDSEGFRSDGKSKVVLHIQTAFRWLRSQNLGDSRRKGHWSLTLLGWSEFGPPESSEDSEEILWDWVVESIPCWGMYRQDLDTCKRCLCATHCRVDLLSRLQSWTSIFAVNRKLGFQGEGEVQAILDVAESQGFISPSQSVIYLSVCRNLPSIFEVRKSDGEVCSVCGERIPKGVPLVHKNQSYHVECAAKKKL